MCVCMSVCMCVCVSLWCEFVCFVCVGVCGFDGAVENAYDAGGEDDGL